ncbi:unnamed protein product [Arctogadus glacialis]
MTTNALFLKFYKTETGVLEVTDWIVEQIQITGHSLVLASKQISGRTKWGSVFRDDLSGPASRPTRAGLLKKRESGIVSGTHYG